MASSLAFLVACLVAAASAAPQRVTRQVVNPGLVQPQLIRQGGYLQPQLIQGYGQPARRVALQYSHPETYSYSHGPQVAYSHGPQVTYSHAPQVAYSHAPQVAYSQAPQLAVRHQVSAGRPIAILRQAQDVSFDGTFNYGFESEDGTSVQASGGPLTAVGPEETVQTVTGSYSYISPDGTPITTNWIADENGFRAEGAHLPRGPEGHVRTV